MPTSSPTSSPAPAPDRRPVLVTGATGYIGGRLVPRLLDAGHAVRCLVRDPRKLDARPWRTHPDLEVLAGDLADEAGVTEALRGCRAAYYLVHSMLAAGGHYRETDRRLAAGFARAAAAADLPRIVYLGGLGETGDALSEHLASRREVEQLLAAGPVPVTVLRAAMIIGSGSASFEILHFLTERLPVMVTPRWVRTPCQPIAVRDVLADLIDCLDVPATAGRTLDIGGPDVLTYEDFLQLVSAARGLPRRRILPVPVLTPRLSSLWIHLVTPLSRHIARPLAEGLRNPVVCRDDAARRLMPRRLMGVREAVDAALAHTEAGTVETSWSDAGPVPGDPDWAGGRAFTDAWSIEVRAPAATVFAAVGRIGGGHGYYAADRLWRLRGWLDRLLGGPGLRRGRRDPSRLAYGEALDFWRVTALEPDRRLNLRAEMRLPGQALLAFTLEPGAAAGTTRLVQTARFIPRGLLGLAYWYAVLPLHGVVFRGMLAGIRREAEGGERDGAAAPRRVPGLRGWLRGGGSA